MTTRPFLGGMEGTFSQAFPHIGQFKIEVDQGDAVWGEAVPGYFSSVFTANHPPPPVIGCSNRLCQQGGLRIEALIPGPASEYPYSYENIFRCNGHEGSPKGRRIGRSCMNSFRVKMHFEAKS